MFTKHVLSRKRILLVVVVLSLLTLLFAISKLSLLHGNVSRVNPQIISTFITGYAPASINTSNTTHVHVRATRKVQQYPQAIIIGVRKAGTRALINMLNIHPDIVSAREEVHFFDRNENYEKGVDWYISRMPRTTSTQITIEKTPSYFVHDDVPHRMAAQSTHVKLLLIVRNPIDRAVSDFTQLYMKQMKKTGSLSSFEQLAFDSSSSEVNRHYPPISVSMYDIHFKNWLKYFERSDILIVDGDSLIKNPVHELQKAEDFLQVKRFFDENMFYYNNTKGFYCWKRTNKYRDNIPACLGSSKGREHPTLSDESRSRLKTFFQPHNERFFKLIGQTFEW